MVPSRSRSPRPATPARLTVLLLAVVLALSACTTSTPTDPASAPAGELAAPPADALYRDPAAPVEARIEDLLSRMTLDEKLGQMTLVEKDALEEGDLARLSIGAVLSGGGGAPRVNSPERWADMVDGFQDEAATSRLGVPVLYGVDAVHGHNNVVGATIFPHNIGLGAAGDPQLVHAIGAATAVEMLATGIPWNYAPVVAVPQDIRWGRTYEAYAADVEVVTELATAFLEGLQSIEGPLRVVGTPKHFVADGAAEWDTATVGDHRIDQGDASITEEELRTTHLPPYVAAVEAGARTVMASYSSWQGQKVHGRGDLLTDLLKDELGFDGLLVSDWGAVDQVDDNYYEAVVASVNAGIDLNMVPQRYELWLDALRAAVDNGDVPIERIDDAVRRVLRVKFEIGLFEAPLARRELLDQVGSAAHRALAREAVAASLVPLTGSDVLPLDLTADRILVAGEAANDLGMQLGGWSIAWQGGRGRTTEGTTVLQALRQASDAEVDFSRFGRFEERAPVGIAVVGEEPYAEGAGDDPSPSLDEGDLATIRRLREMVDTLVVVVYSGRPVLLGEVPEVADAVVAAWLPGTEGAGVVDGLLGHSPLSGALPFGWPDAEEQLGPGAGPTWLPAGHGAPAGTGATACDRTPAGAPPTGRDDDREPSDGVPERPYMPDGPPCREAP
jgi:beta-glucosidase